MLHTQGCEDGGVRANKTNCNETAAYNFLSSIKKAVVNSLPASQFLVQVFGSEPGSVNLGLQYGHVSTKGLVFFLKESHICLQPRLS